MTKMAILDGANWVIYESKCWLQIKQQTHIILPESFKSAWKTKSNASLKQKAKWKSNVLHNA